MPKKKKVIVKIIRKPTKVIKKKPILIIQKPKLKQRTRNVPIIINTRNNIKVVRRDNPLKQKSENWLQKTKFISSALDQVGSVYPIASFGAKIARMQGYGRHRGVPIHNNVVPINVSVPKNNNVSTSTNYKSRALNETSKYGKYVIPTIIAGATYGYINGVRSKPSQFEEFGGKLFDDVSKKIFSRIPHSKEDTPIILEQIRKQFTSLYE